MSDLAGSDGVVDRHVSRAGRWLRARRIRIALWIAALEGLVALFATHYPRFIVIALAVVAVMAYLGARDSRSDLVRQVVWIFAASQLLAVIVVVLAWLVKWAVILAAVIFAVVGLLYLLRDRS